MDRQRLSDACLEWRQKTAEREYFANAPARDDVIAFDSFDLARDRDDFRQLANPAQRLKTPNDRL